MTAEPWLGALPLLAPVANCLESGVMLIDENRRIVLASEPLAAMFGRAAEEIRGMTPELFMEYVASLVDDPPVLLRERRLLDGASVVCEEFELKRPARSMVRWVARRLGPPDAPASAQVVVCTDITAEVDLNAAYERLAVTDRLTGLANRRGAEQVARREIARVRRFGAPVSFVMLDLDHFKSVNDRLGHGVGDQVLQTVARAISRTLRETDLAARWGGEEFLLILPSTPLESAVACAERVRHLVADLPLATGDRITVSGGVAQLRHGEDLADVVARADQALYEAKAAGRNQIR